MRTKFILVMALFNVNVTKALPTGAPICDVLANYQNVTGMQNRTRNFNSGTYLLTANVSEYNTFEHVEITISGDSFLGLMFTVEDGQGNKVGSFSPDTQVRDCGNEAMSITHSERLGLTEKTLFWIPPEEPVGSVYVMGYVLKGAAGDINSQGFYRFVREDSSALELLQSEVIYYNGFD